MKKFFLFFLSLTLTLGAFSGCGFLSSGEGSTSQNSVENSIEGSTSDTSSGDKESSEKKVFYWVIFKQEGENDIVKQVEEGKMLLDVPTPTQKTGYTTKWSVEDFSQITENLTVTAISTANEYTITYDAGEGEVYTATQTVAYDAIPGAFATPTRGGYNFVCWTYEGKAVQATDVWKVASDVTLVATWVEIEKRTVTFVQDGYEPIIFEVLDGEAFDGALTPKTQAKEGYTVVWEEKIPSQITENIIINAVATPNTYYITYNAGEGNVNMAQQGVVYDSVPGSFAVPTREGYKFKGWEYEGKVISAGDVWTIAKDVTLTAKWARICTITLNANGGKLEQTTITVVVGEAYALPSPTRLDYCFVAWKDGSTKVALSGTWTMDVAQITLTADWIDDGWTKNY